MFSFDWRKWSKQARGNERARRSEPRRFRPALEALEDRVVLSTAVTTAATPATAVFSPTAQTVTLTANVTDPANSSDIVNEGTVTFTVMDSHGTAVGTVTSGSVTNGVATASGFSLPANEPVGAYTITVSYLDSGGMFTDGGDTPSTLTIGVAPVNTIANPASATFSAAAQNVTLSASVIDTHSPSTTVTEGTVTFTVVDSNGHTVGTPVSAAVSNGMATAMNFSLPAGEAAGSYTIQVSYADSAGNFSDSGTGDGTGTLSLGAANVTTVAQGTSANYGSPGQSVTLRANVSNASTPSDTVNEGTVTFTIVNSNGDTVGTVQGSVSGGSASANFTIPGSLANGTYTVQVAFSDSAGNFTDTGDTAANLALTYTTPATLVTEFFQGYAQLPLVQMAGGQVMLAQQVMLLYAQAATMNPTQATSLVQDEILLVYDGYLALDQETAGITDPTLQARITALEQSITTNPLYNTALGYQLGLSVATLAGNDLALPDVASKLEVLALQQGGTSAAL